MSSVSEMDAEFSVESSDAGFEYFKYTMDTPHAISEAKIGSIVCIHCKLRLGVTDLRADAVRCSECGKTTKLHDAREKQKLVPGRMPASDLARQCRRCKTQLAVPKGVNSYQCAKCGQINIAGRASYK